MSKLIVGLCNPGARYRHTRHNLGAMVVEAVTDKLGASFKSKSALNGMLAICEVSGEKYYFLLPTTFMNLSGSAVVKTLGWFRLALEDLIVIVDDVDLPFGKIRYRAKGSSGGHNGLRDIESQLGSQEFARLKMGIGSVEGQRNVPLEDFVLSAFSLEEKAKLDPFIQGGVEVLMGWIEGGSSQALKEIEKVNIEDR